MKEYDNPNKFLKNHLLIINNKVVINRDVEYQNENNNLDENMYKNRMHNFNMIENIVCNLNAKLYITDKAFAEITILDALPYRMNFNSNEHSNTPYDMRYNNQADRIETIENIISNIRKQLVNDKIITESKRDKYTQDIANFEREIVDILGRMKPINAAYQNHILHRTVIGVRCMFNDNLNSHKSLIYLRPICMNNSKLNSLFRFKYEISKSKMDDVFSLFINNDYLETIINANIKKTVEINKVNEF